MVVGVCEGNLMLNLVSWMFKYFKMIDMFCKICTTSLMISLSASKSKVRIYVEEGCCEGMVMRILCLNV